MEGDDMGEPDTDLNPPRIIAFGRWSWLRRLVENGGLAFCLAVGLGLVSAAPTLDWRQEFFREESRIPDAASLAAARIARERSREARGQLALAMPIAPSLASFLGQGGQTRGSPGSKEPVPFHNLESDKHFVNTDTHYSNSDYHQENTDYHFISSHTHYSNSDFHTPPSHTHYTNTDTHIANSDYHWDNTDAHFANTDTHTGPSDYHWDNSDSHSSNSDSHTAQSSTHTGNSHWHHDGSDTHPITTTYHWTNSDSHTGTSSTHYSSTSTTQGDPNGNNCPTPGQPNRGEATVNGSSSATINTFTTSCNTTFQVGHKIVTYNTPRARNLHGMLRLNVESGDPSVVKLMQQGMLYTPGSAIPVVEFGHSGCGVHTWHYGSIPFTVYPVKEGTVTLRAEVDPDPEPEGDGGPGYTALIAIEVPPFEDHEIVYKTFIQCEAVVNPSPFPFCCDYFGGDNRYLSYTQGAAFGSGDLGSRTAQKAMVTVDPDAAAIVSLQQEFGESDGYLIGQVWSPVPSAPCEFAIIPGQTPYMSATQSSTLDFTEITAPPGALGETIRRFKIVVDAANPLEPSSYLCPIVAEIEVDIKECGGHAWYRYSGERTKFPAHEMYIDTTAALTFTPPDPDDSTQLCYPNQTIPLTPWTLLP